MVTEQDLQEEQIILQEVEEEIDEHEISLEDDAISPEEEGFLRGYESASEVEEEEEEL